MIQQTKLSLTASDVTGQRRVSLGDVSLDATLGEVIDSVLPAMSLNRRNADGRELVVEARLEREGRQLHRSELVRDVLRHEDEIVLHPRVMAGRGARSVPANI
jgi:hypothetical protein